MSARQPLPSWALNVLMPAMNVLLALFVGGLAVAIIGENPIEAMKVLAYGAFGYGTGLGFTLHFATSFVFTGLAVAVAFHAGLFNIGGEGQAYVAGLGAIVMALWLDQTHWTLVLLGSTVAAMALGAVWAAIPGYLQAKRGSHIVITTIMFNFIASALMSYMLAQVITNPGANAETRTIAETGRLPLLSEYFEFFKYSPVNITFVFGILALIFVYVLIWRTKLGYKIRTLGANPDAARYAGISAVTIILIAMAIAGALAGLMAVNEAVGVQKRLVVGYVQGFGFVGIAVAFMGRAHPIGIAFAALLFGALYQGGQELAFVMPAVPSDLVVVIQALVILFSGAMDEMFKPMLERVFDAFRSPSGQEDQPDKKEA
ncbi:ABC transporter permease [Maritalea sp.]|uniref:ABC transporter permease n=1 Tax=Maritalea sp. TaxID=2003361 RepID=UPI003EF174C7